MYGVCNTDILIDDYIVSVSTGLKAINLPYLETTLRTSRWKVWLVNGGTKEQEGKLTLINTANTGTSRLVMMYHYFKVMLLMLLTEQSDILMHCNNIFLGIIIFNLIFF